MSMDLSDEILQDLYCWVDQIPLSRPKRNIGRDFSDGVLVAEIIQHFYPRLVDMHNYTPTNAVARKAYNWSTLNKRVFRVMRFCICPEDVDAVVNVRRLAIERVLLTIRQKMGEYETKRLKKVTCKPSRAPEEMHPGAHEPESHSAISEPFDCRVAKPLSDQVNTDDVDDDAELRRLLQEKDLRLARSQQTIEILAAKVEKLEQLLELKDGKINALTQHLEELELHELS